MRKDDIIVSVIILTFNHQNYIRRAIDSILKQQTNFRYEILIGDDASEDLTPKILEEYKQKYSDVIRLELRHENIGASGNFVDLIKRARGRYIASCEGDDFWTDKNKLQRQVDFLEQNLCFIGCTHDISIVDIEGNPLNDIKLGWIKDKPVFKLKDFKGIYLPGHPVSMVYRNVLTSNSQACELIMQTDRNIADRTIAMLVLAKGDIARINCNMASYTYSRRNERNNLTAIKFSNDPYGKLLNMTITNRLEGYARTVLGVHLNFDMYRVKLVLKAFAAGILLLSPMYFDCTIKMIKSWLLYRTERKAR